MNGFEKISHSEFDSVFDRIGKQWMLISASDGERANTMTASWGGLGILWNKPVAFCFIRPQRFTCPIAERAGRLTLSFLDEEYRKALTLCGRLSGRDVDKFKEAGLTLTYTDAGDPYPAEASFVLVCRTLYLQEMTEDSFVDKSLLSHYEIKDYHKVFVCEIEEIWKK